MHLQYPVFKWLFYTGTFDFHLRNNQSSRVWRHCLFCPHHPYRIWPEMILARGNADASLGITEQRVCSRVWDRLIFWPYFVWFSQFMFSEEKDEIWELEHLLLHRAANSPWPGLPGILHPLLFPNKNPSLCPKMYYHLERPNSTSGYIFMQIHPLPSA